MDLWTSLEQERNNAPPARLILTAFAIAAAPALAQQGALVGDPAEAHKKIAMCEGCHGADGDKPVGPENPILAGQYYDYLAKALSDYKTGKRGNAVMNGVAAQLSRQDIEDLAAWFFRQKSSTLHFQR